MSILVYTENWDGKFKKLSFELVSYAYELASKMNSSVSVLSIGSVAEEELSNLGRYGASKIIAVNDSKLKGLDNKAYTTILAKATEKENATIIVMANNNTGKAIAPRLSVRLKAGLINGAIGAPLSYEPFIVPKKVFCGKGFANAEVKTPIKILTLFQNAFGIFENPCQATIEEFHPELDEKEFSTTIHEVNKSTGKLLLTDAEIVVSGGRGMKGPENWGLIEELAKLLGAATACSRPVADEGWRPHEEHTGQTGKVIAPNLYFALGISGAIQHIAGVSGSKCIVAVNKDPEAPIFEVADYGIIGDVMKVLPELIDAVKVYKAN